ncbi:MAG: DUF2752 domain-containing protein [Clostridia bacterium]|nr:DUF2752 domain-containing protein [Clostridia bacterium]
MKKFRFAVLPLYFAAFAGIFLYAYLKRPFEAGGYPCPIHAVLGIKCVSCGATRAAYKLLVGDIAGAFYYNALFTVGFLPAFAIGLCAAINLVSGRKVIPLPKPRAWHLAVVAAVFVAFTAARNLVSFIY